MADAGAFGPADVAARHELAARARRDRQGAVHFACKTQVTGRRTPFCMHSASTARNDVCQDALELMCDLAAHPLIVVCRCTIMRACINITSHSYGVHETGVVVGCLRRLQRWPLSAALAEVRRIRDS